MYQSGGRLSISVGGKKLSPRASGTLDPAGLEHEVMSNHDRTISRSTKNKPITFEVTFDRGQGLGIRWDEAFMLPFYDATFIESDTKILHTFTNATFVGSPKINTESGEVTGLTLACGADDYSATPSS